MSHKPIVIFGIGKIADVAFQHMKRDNSHEVVAFTCDRQWLPKAEGSTFHDLPVHAFEDLESRYPADRFALFIAIGYHELNAARAERYTQAKSRGYELTNYVSLRANVGPWLHIGDNCLVLDGVGIQPGTVIGSNVSIWNNTLIGHHSKVDDHCWLAANATLGGCVRLGERSFVGLNATVGGEVELGERCFVGGGANVMRSAPPKSVYVAPSTEKFRLDSDAFVRMTRMPAMGRREVG